jgi:hypothetical protein
MTANEQDKPSRVSEENLPTSLPPHLDEAIIEDIKRRAQRVNEQNEALLNSQWITWEVLRKEFTI